jgi:hypothetical protein
MKNENLIEEIEYRGYTINVCYDINAENPDEWENDDMFIVYDHRDFCVKRKGFNPREIFDVFQTKNLYDNYHIFS